MCHMLLINIFQKENSSESASASVVRNLFKDPPAGPKVCWNSVNWWKFTYSYVTYFVLPYFREHVKDRPWQEIFSQMQSHQPQRYFWLVIISQNFIIHIWNISCCHISEKTLVANMQESNHGCWCHHWSATCRKGIFDRWLWVKIFLFIRQIFPIPLFQKKILLDGKKTLRVFIEKLPLVHKVFLICDNQFKFP